MDVFTGTILPWAMDWAPHDWAICDGSILQIGQYQALYSLLGNNFGGDGKTNFALPDLRGRTILGFGAGPGLTPRPFAQKAGNESVKLTVSMLAPHAHTATFTPGGAGSASGSLKASSAGGTTTNPDGNYIANAVYSAGAGPSKTTATLPSYVEPANAGKPAVVAGLTISGSGGGGGTVAVGNTGGTDAVPTVPPFVALNYIICLNGIYPPRP